MAEYGTVAWFESQYRRTATDPWGLTWRPTQLYRYAFMIEKVRQCLAEQGIAQVSRILDVGCATGDFTHLLSRLPARPEGHQIVGADLSHTAIERARARYPGIDFRQADLDHLSTLSSERFDFVSCLEVLYYIPREARALAVRSLWQAVEPNGTVLISTMIGKAPYLQAPELRALVAQRFDVLASGTLKLWPLVRLEKLVLRFAKPFRPRSVQSFWHGARGYSVMTRLCSLAGATFGSRAESHAWVIGRRS